MKTNEVLDRMEKLANDATPGDRCVAIESGDSILCIGDYEPMDFTDADIEFHAVASPSTILALIAIIRRQREALEFFAQDFTWSRVYADAYASHIGSGLLQNMYGSKAKKAIAETDKLLEGIVT